MSKCDICEKEMSEYVDNDGVKICKTCYNKVANQVAGELLNFITNKKGKSEIDFLGLLKERQHANL